MKKPILIFLLIALATVAFAQEIDIDEIDPTQIDFGEVDVSDAEFYFNGPIELYVTGLRYQDTVYSALMSYDGDTTIRLGVPDAATTRGKPQEIDLSAIRIEPTDVGIRLSGFIADGRRYNGVLTLQPSNDLELAGISPAADAGPGVQQLRRDIRSLERAVDERDEEIASLEEEIASLESTIESRDNRIERLNRQIDDLPEEERVAELRSQVDELEDENESARDRIARLESQLASRTDRVSTLEERVDNLREPWADAEDRLSETLVSGLGDGRAAGGSWNRNGGALVQSNDAALFAKYLWELDQGEDDLMYSFTGRATGSGWMGYGLHILADEFDSERGYGLGSSYLVWITFDPEHNRNRRTYVELYRSYDDVRMEYLAGAARGGDITTSHDVDVYVDRESSTIAILLDGTRVLEFRDDEMIATGSAVAARTLGTARITALRVLSE